MNDFEKELVNAQKQLYSYALSLTANEDDARDLLQDTMLRILKSFDRYTNQGHFVAWALVVMKNVFKNNLRSSVVGKRSFIDGYDTLYESDDNLLVCDTEYRYIRDEIYDIIASLPQVQGKPLILRMWGYKYEEIAVKLNIPLGSVKSNLFIAKNRLKKILEGE